MSIMFTCKNLTLLSFQRRPLIVRPFLEKFSLIYFAILANSLIFNENMYKKKSNEKKRQRYKVNEPLIKL